MPYRIRGCGRVCHRAVAGVVRGYDDVAEFLRRRPRRFHRNLPPGQRVKKIDDRPLSGGGKSGRQVQRITLTAVRTAHNFGNHLTGRKWRRRDLRHSWPTEPGQQNYREESSMHSNKIVAARSRKQEARFGAFVRSRTMWAQPPSAVLPGKAQPSIPHLSRKTRQMGHPR